MGRKFQTTSWSLVLTAREGDDTEAEKALAELCEAYWLPLYTFVRHEGHSADEAADLVQGYFATLLEKRYLDDARPSAGRFRSFLLASLKHYVYNEYDREKALKRGGSSARISLDTDEAEQGLRIDLADHRSPETAYERRWALTVVGRVLSTLEQEQRRAGHGERFAALEGYLTGGEPHAPYREVAAELGMSEPAVKVAVHRLRTRFGALLRKEIAATVGDPEQVDDEIRHLLEVLQEEGGMR